MPLYRFTDTQPRVYVDRALLVNPGDEVEWETPPDDGQWVPVGKSKAKTSSEE